MPLAAIVSGSPCLDFEGVPAFEPANGWHADLHGPDGWRSWWILPTSRRRRQIVQAAKSTRLPRVLVLDGLIQYLEGFSRIQHPTIGNTGELLRIARAWTEASADASLSVGRVVQLQRIASEWRETGEAPKKGHPHCDFLRAYDAIIRSDRCLDRPAALQALAREIEDASSPLARQLRDRKVLFDGFHRFSVSEWKLIEAIGRHADVRLWLVAAKDQPCRARVMSALAQRKIQTISDDRKAPSELPALGRTLFTTGPCSTSGVGVIAAQDVESECGAVAAHIKSQFASWGKAGRLSDIAVIIPDDTYLPPLKATLKAARIDYSPAAEVFALASSRPGRLLLLALRLIRHGWEVETLFDFLRQPILMRRLTNGHLLEWFRQRSSQRAAHRSWIDWKREWSERIKVHEKAALADEERRDEPEKERKQSAKQMAGELNDLLKTIDQVLSDVEKLEKELHKKAANDPARLVAAIAAWLESMRISDRLSPVNQKPDWKVIPPREWEIDQLAFNNLTDALAELHDTPAGDLPCDSTGKVDVELALRLALAAETFQTRADDEAGVQILKPRTIRGSRFRMIVAMGMVEGKWPTDSIENPATREANSPIERLRAEEKHEQEYLFAQMFESAQERILLTRPEKENDAPLMASPFLRHVCGKLGIKDATKPTSTVIDLRQALARLDCPELNDDPVAKAMLDTRRLWQKRQAPNDLQIRDWAMPLLQARYPKEKPFSATALEKYAACPFHHFAAKTLGLDELERDDSAMRWGSFLHEVLDDFFKKKLTPNRDSFLCLLRDCWPRVANTLDATHLHDFEKALTDALMAINAFLGENGYSQVEAEWENEAIALSDGQGNELLLHVKIDRIDRHADGQSEIISDFKSGVTESGGRLIERLHTGRRLQLPLYGYARQHHSKIPVKHGLYVKLSRKVKAEPGEHAPFLVSVGEALSTGRRMSIPFSPDDAFRIALGLAANIRAGMIRLTQFDATQKDPACQSYCSARHACRQPKGYKT